MNKVCVVGIGRVGLSFATVLANKGLQVIGIDIDVDLVNMVNGGKSPFWEPGLVQPLALAVAEGRLSATSDYSEVGTSNTVVITTNMTPQNREEYVQMIGKIGRLLQPDKLVMIRTTLPIDMIDEVCNTLEKESGLVVEKDLFLAFVPERFVEGNAVEEIIHLPQLVGAYGEGSFKRADEILSRINNDIVRLEPETAVFAKLINNIYRNTIFALANEIALISEMYGVDALEAIEAANYNYSRSNIPIPGLVGGTCLPKDIYLMLPSKVEFPDLVVTAKELNDYIPHHIFRTIMRIKKPKLVCILGLAFKKGVNDTRGSQSNVLVDLFTNEGIEVYTHDPFISQFSVEEALDGADVIILATNHSEYSKIPELVSNKCIFYDCWGMYKLSNFKKCVTYIGLGRTKQK